MKARTLGLVVVPALAGWMAASASAQQPTPPIGAVPAGQATPEVRQPIRAPADPSAPPATAPAIDPAQPAASPAPTPEAAPGAETALPGVEPALPVDTAPVDAAPVAIARPRSAPAPGTERSLDPPAFEGEAGTPLGDPALFRSLSPTRKAWFLREYHLARGNLDGADGVLPVLRDLKEDTGTENLAAIGVALAREARELARAKNGARAVTVATAATALAPDLPATHGARLRARMAAGDWGGAFAALRETATASLRNLRVRQRIEGNALMALLAGLVLSHAGFLAVVWLRHGRFLAHDFRHAFADKMPAWLATVILVPLLAFPLVFGLGFLPLLAWLTLVAWVKLEMRERVVAAIFLLAGIGIPVLVHQAAGSFAFLAGDASRLYAAVAEDEVPGSALAELTALADTTGDPELLATLGNLHLREGRYGTAETFYRRAADRGAGAAARVGLGNVRYALGDVSGAIGLYEQALAADPKSLAANFNLVRMHNERTEIDKASRYQAAARAIDARTVDERLANPPPQGRKNTVEPETGSPIVAAAYVNRLLLVANTPPARLLARADDDAAAIARQTWRRFSPALPLAAMPWIFGGALAIAGALGWLAHGAISSRPCPRCRRRLCLACDGPPYEQDYCVQCFHAFLHTEGVDPRARAGKEREVRAAEDRMRRRRRILSAFAPGAGHLLGGDTARGAVLLCVASLCVVRIAAWHGWIRPSFPIGDRGWIAPVAACGVVFAVAWFLGLKGHESEQQPVSIQSARGR